HVGIGQLRRAMHMGAASIRRQAAPSDTSIRGQAAPGTSIRGHAAFGTSAVVILLVAALCAGTEAAPRRPPPLARARAALRALSPQARAALDRDLYEGARATCHADAQPPTAACLIDLARQRCAQPAASGTQSAASGAPDAASCAAAADVIVANMLSVADFVD